MGFYWGFKGLNAQLNPICHLLALLGTHHIIHISRIRVNLCTAFSRLYTVSAIKTWSSENNSVDILEVNFGSVSSPLCVCENWKVYVVKHNSVK